MVGIKIRFEDIQILNRDFTIDSSTADADAIRHAGGVYLRSLTPDRRIRLLGVQICSLCPAKLE